MSEGEILGAFAVCLEQAPDRVTFFAPDFLKWRKVFRQRMEKAQLAGQKECDWVSRQRDWEEQRQAILAEQQSCEGQKKVEAAIASLPWRRGKGGVA